MGAGTSRQSGPRHPRVGTAADPGERSFLDPFPGRVGAVEATLCGGCPHGGHRSPPDVGVVRGPEAGAAPARGPSQGVVGLLLQGLSLRRPS